MSLFGKKRGRRPAKPDSESSFDETSSFVALTRPQALFFEYVKDPLIKRLINQVSLLQEEDGFKSMTVVSELPREGRTFVIAALALGYSCFLKKRVLIVDTVSRSRPESFFSTALVASSLHSSGAFYSSSGGRIELMTTQNEESRISSIGGVHTSHGKASQSSQNRDNQSIHDSTTGFSEDEFYREVAWKQESGENTVTEGINLDETERRGSDLSPISYRPSFFSDTAEFQLGNLITAMAPSYDLILVDTCALRAARRAALDPIVLAKQTDGVLVVTTKETLGREALVRIKAQLGQSRLRVFGTIFNRPVKS
jgi:hypothetical protein